MAWHTHAGGGHVRCAAPPSGCLSFCHNHDRLSPQIRRTDYAQARCRSRFLQVDPVEGGSANDYDYVEGDPVNGFDLAGTCKTKHPGSWPWGDVRSIRCRASHAVGHVRHAPRTAYRGSVRAARATKSFFHTHHFERSKCVGQLIWTFSGKASGNPTKAWPQVGVGTKCVRLPTGPGTDVRPDAI
jgi:hypothetical protein